MARKVSVGPVGPLAHRARRPGKQKRSDETREVPAPPPSSSPRMGRPRRQGAEGNMTLPFFDEQGAGRSEPMPAPHIHSGEARLGRVLDFVTFATKPMPLGVLLDEAPRKIASIMGADVVSLYLLEGQGDHLVMRGNVGFPLRARGRVRLGVGEGITGMAVECLRPISVVGAPQHESFRGFPELDEERFPVFLAVPILGGDGALGALVVQRAGERAFKPGDVDLIVALTAPIASAIRHAHLIDRMREKTTSRKTGGGTRKITLPGVPIVPGRALGAIAALRRPATSSPGSRKNDDPRLLLTAFEVADKALGALVGKARAAGVVAEAEFLSNYLLMVNDSRLRERAFELTTRGRGIADALGEVAREAARAATGIVGDQFLRDRAADLEDLCDALLMLSSPDSRAELPTKGVLVGDQLTVFDLLVSARSHPVGVALTERAVGPRSRVLLRLLGVPAIVDVAGVFRWSSPGDLALLDADHGFLVINPTRAEMASVRAERRSPMDAPPSRPGTRALDADLD